MLGLLSRKGRHGALAIVVATALMGLGISAAVAAEPSAEGDASALTATGALVGEGGLDLNSDECRAQIPGGNPAGAGLCDRGINTNENVDGFDQEAKAGPNGSNCAALAAEDGLDMYGNENPVPQYVHPGASDMSCAIAGVTGFNVVGLDTISTEDLVTNGLAGINTGTLLDQIVGPVGTALDTLLQNNAGLLTSIDTAIKGITVPLDESLPVSLQVGTTGAACAATPSGARGNSRIESLALNVNLGGQTEVNVPFTGPNDLDTPPNTPLVGGSLVPLANAIFDGLDDTLGTSLDGALSGLALLTNSIRDAIVNQVLVQLQDSLLSQLDDALSPLVQGVVNKQVDGHNSNNKVTYTSNSTREIEVAALDVRLLQGGGEQAQQTLQLARVHCGPDSLGNGGGPGLQVLKTAKSKGNGKVEYTIRVHNPLNSAVDDVLVKDFYPSGAKDVTVTSKSQGSFNVNTGVWSVGTLPSNATATLKIEAKVSKSANNVACVVSDPGASKPDHVQPNDTFADDTDGCDDSKTHKKHHKHHKKHKGHHKHPKSVNSGANSGDLGAMAVAGLLAVAALGGTAGRRRFLA